MEFWSQKPRRRLIVNWNSGGKPRGLGVAYKPYEDKILAMQFQWGRIDRETRGDHRGRNCCKYVQVQIFEIGDSE